jgi:cytoskeleton protein RodZ
MTEQAGESIGVQLQHARERSGKSLHEIANATKLTVRTLTALESERVEQLPGGIYRRAIVRAYAREVGLNPEIVLRAFLDKHPDDLPPLAPLPTRRPTSYDLPPEPLPMKRTPHPIHVMRSVVGALILRRVARTTPESR